MRKLTVSKITSSAVLFLVLVPNLSHSRSNSDSIENANPVLEARKETVDEQLANAKRDLDLNQDTLMNLHKIDKEVFCMAQNVYFEAGGESFKGKIAVSEVVVARTQRDDYPNDVCGVIKQYSTVTVDGDSDTKRRVCQFSWSCNGPKRIPLTDRSGNIRHDVLHQWRDSVAAAMLVYYGKVFGVSKGATHFYSTKSGRPSWANRMQSSIVIGGHTFVRQRDIN